MEYKSKIQQYFTSMNKIIYNYVSDKSELRTSRDFGIVKTAGLSLLLVASILASKQIDKIHKKQSLENTIQQIQTQIYAFPSNANYNMYYFK